MSYSNEYNKRGIMIDVIVKDENFRRLDKFKCRIGTFSEVVNTISRKYGEVVKEKKKEDNQDKDMDWLRKVDW